MKRIHHILFAIVFLLLFSTLLVSCDRKTTEEHASHEDAHEEHHDEAIEFTEAQYKNAGIILTTLQKKSLSGSIQVNGVLDVPPQNLVTVSIPYGGTVKQIDLLQGMKVKKGQLLVILEHPDYIQLQQDYVEAKSNLDFMELELDRQEELQRENISAAKTHQQVIAEYQAMKARVSGLEQKLSIINISPAQIKKQGITKQVRLYAPINGYVTQINVNVGMYVNANDIICKLVDTEHLHAELTVFEKDVARLKIGQKIRFRFNGDEQEHTAHVYLIGKEIESDRTVRVHGHLDQEDHTLLPGMYLKASIETATEGVMTLPAESIVQLEGKSYVFIFEGKEEKEGVYRFKQQEVQTGLTQNDSVEILTTSAIDSTTQIVSKGAYDLLSQTKVGEEEGHAH